MRKRAQQTIRKLLSSLGGSSLAHGLLGELCVVINKHKVQTDNLSLDPQNYMVSVHLQKYHIRLHFVSLILTDCML